jgi:hypothetical protein
MKKLICLMIFCFTAHVLLAQSRVISTADTIVKPKAIEEVLWFKNADYDFGRIAFGKPVEYKLEMKNISKDSIEIQNVRVTCGCTTPKWQAGKKYGPGENFSVILGFNAGVKGPFSKGVTLFFSYGLFKMVTFKGETYEPSADSTGQNH